VADLWTSTFFGNALDEETYLAQAQKILAGDKINNPQATACRFFHWELEFPKVFFNDDGKPSEAPGFDAVIGNPPYDADLDSQEKIFINACVNLSDNGRLDTASLFVEQFLRFTAPRRALGYLLPQRLIGRQRDFGPFQRFIYREGGMREVIYLGTVEEFASNDEFVIMTFVNGYKGDFIVAYNVPKERFPHIDSFKKIIRRDLWGPPNYAFNIYLNEFSQDILEKINAHSFKLGDIAESKDGIVVFIRDKLVSETQKDARYRKLLGISGRYFLDRYALDWQPMYICYDINEAKQYITDPVELRKVQLRDERIFTKPEKLLTRQDSITLRGTIDHEQFFHTNSIHTTYLKSGTPYSLNYVLCLINSPTLSYYYKTLNLKGQDLHPQILVTNIPKLPIRRIAFTTTSPERKRYLAAAIKLYERSLSANDFGRTLEFVDQQLRENRSDVVHDLLVFLADRLIEMNKRKCTTARQFLTDLKDFHGIDVRSLNPKTKMDEFWKLEAADVFVHFRANKVQLRGSDEEKIRERFSKSKSALVPLDSQIAFTDQLIDQIVYRLYGLTPEEIKIVKGTNKNR
jgi:hypothetical protein